LFSIAAETVVVAVRMELPILTAPLLFRAPAMVSVLAPEGSSP
jgi:hypothetical protein